MKAQRCSWDSSSSDRLSWHPELPSEFTCYQMALNYTGLTYAMVSLKVCSINSSSHTASPKSILNEQQSSDDKHWVWCFLLLFTMLIDEASIRVIWSQSGSRIQSKRYLPQHIVSSIGWEEVIWKDFAEHINHCSSNYVPSPCTDMYAWMDAHTCTQAQNLANRLLFEMSCDLKLHFVIFTFISHVVIMPLPVCDPKQESGWWL